MEDKELLKEAKKIFKNIAELCYDIDYIFLHETVCSLEHDVKRSTSIEQILDTVSEIIQVIDDIPYLSEEDLELVEEVRNLYYEMGDLTFE